MWHLPTRGRPRECQQVLDACEVMGMTSPGIVFVDGPTTPEADAAYRALRLPPNWDMHVSPTRQFANAQMQWVLGSFPAETIYAQLHDDMVPQTREFDRLLEDAAGHWGFSQANDGGFCAGLKPDEVRRGAAQASAPCWGGDLVRAVGWWGFPSAVQFGADIAWWHIVPQLGCCTYLPDVMIEHRHWRAGKRVRGGNDLTRHDRAVPFVPADLAAIEAFCRGPELAAAVDRVRRAMAA